MKRIPMLIVLAAAPLLSAALWMDDQPSFKAYEAPAPAPPAGSVPVSGKEAVERGDAPRNPVAPTEASLTQGKGLFEINCAMCHGRTSAERGPVGKKLTPSPPGLERAVVRSRSDAHIYSAVTFGFGRMPSFQDKLTSGERWNLINYLRTRE